MPSKQPSQQKDETQEGRNRDYPKKIGDPCEFIDPPNLLLAKVTHDPALATMKAIAQSKFVLDPKRKKRMNEIIVKSEAHCTETLNNKIKEISPFYNQLKKGETPERSEVHSTLSDVYGLGKVLDHIPVTQISKSILRYLDGVPDETRLSIPILMAHFDALFNRDTLSLKLDPQTKQVLIGLDALVDHALSAHKEK